MLLCFALLALGGFAPPANASYAIPVAKLPNGDLVNLDNGRILMGPQKGQRVSPTVLKQLRTRAHGRRSTGSAAPIRQPGH